MKVSKKSKTATPHAALRQIRAAIGCTQEEFAHLLDFSRAYVQAVEIGQRPATPEFAKRVMIMTGAWQRCIFPGQPTAFDLEGNPYTSESYRQYQGFVPQKLSGRETLGIVNPVFSLAHFGASLGKSRLVAQLMYDAVQDFQKELSKLSRSQKSAPPIGDTVTRGVLRAHPKLAEAVNYFDDPSRPDDELIPLDAKGKIEFPMMQIPNPLTDFVHYMNEEAAKASTSDGPAEEPVKP